MKTRHNTLSRRERQIMDVLYQKGRATAADVLDGLPDPPSYSAVRALLRILEQKGHVRHEDSEEKYVFIPTLHLEQAKRSAIRHLLKTFFDGSPEEAVETLLDVTSSKLSREELDRLAGLIEKARQGGKK